MTTTVVRHVAAPRSALIESALSELRSIFEKARDKHAAHGDAERVLRQLTFEPRFVTEVLERYLLQQSTLTRLNYPVVAMPIDSNPYFDLVMNCWIPLPDGRTDLSTKAIHHHGTLLLSTATLFGPGYEHWMFSRPRPLDGSDSRFGMHVLEAKRHARHHVSFVDRFTPHLPVYPSSLTLTLALWSTSTQTTWRDRLKRVPVVQRNRDTLRQLTAKLGLSKALQLKFARDFDFFPVDGVFEVVPDRREFQLGPNEDHLASLFHVLQETGNSYLVRVIEQRLEREHLVNRSTVERFVQRCRAGERIAGRLSPGHTDVPFANFSTSTIARSAPRPATHIAPEIASHGR